MTNIEGEKNTHGFVSFDVKTLFLYILLDLTIHLILKGIYDNCDITVPISY